MHPKKFIHDFIRSSWKIGFLRKYCPLPLGSLFLAVKNKLASSCNGIDSIIECEDGRNVAQYYCTGL